MRILVIGINYWPERTGIAPFTTGRCEYLAARGHQVTVCTALPYYPQWRIAAGYRRRMLVRETRNGVTILRSRIYVPRRVNSIRRLLHEGSFVMAAWARALVQRRPDLIVCVSPPLGLALPAVILSRLWGVPYVFHVPDLQPDAALDLGMLPAGRIAQLLYAIERLAYRKAALVSTLTAAMRQRIIAKGIAPEKVKLCPDWAAPELFAIPAEGGGREFRVRHGLEGQFLVLHAGNMGVKQGLEVVLDAAARSRGDERLTYLLVGDGAARARLQEHAAACGLANVCFIPLQSDAGFMDLLAAADVGLITQQRVVADIVFPSKTVTLLAAARPLIASVNPSSEVARVVNEAGAGMVVEAGNPLALNAAVEALRQHPQHRRAMGMQGREYADTHWGREAILNESAAVFEQAAGGAIGGYAPARGIRAGSMAGGD